MSRNKDSEMSNKLTMRRSRIRKLAAIFSAIGLSMIALLLFVATRYMHVAINNGSNEKIIIERVMFGHLPANEATWERVA